MQILVRLAVLGLVGFGNWLALWVLVSTGHFFQSLITGGSLTMPAWMMGVTIGLIVVLGIVAASPLGERFYRLFYPIRPLTRREAAEMTPAFEQVREAYKGQHQRPLEATLYLIDDPMPQAFALGTGTIMVTRGALELSEPEELSGLLAHEVGHLHFRDSVLLNAVLGMSTVTHLLTMAFNVLLSLCRVPLPGVGAIVSIIPMLVMAVPLMMLGMGLLINWAINALVSFVLRYGSRSVEYRADTFASDLGFGSGLVGFLERLAGMEINSEQGFLVMSLRSHPPTALRIDRLEQRQEEVKQAA